MAFSVISFYLIYFTLCEYYGNSKIMLLSQSHDDRTASAVRALEMLLYISRSDVCGSSILLMTSIYRLVVWWCSTVGSVFMTQCKTVMMGLWCRKQSQYRHMLHINIVRYLSIYVIDLDLLADPILLVVFIYLFTKEFHQHFSQHDSRISSRASPKMSLFAP